jgi:hypothetical protein
MSKALRGKVRERLGCGVSGLGALPDDADRPGTRDPSTGRCGGERLRPSKDGATVWPQWLSFTEVVRQGTRGRTGSWRTSWTLPKKTSNIWTGAPMLNGSLRTQPRANDWRQACQVPPTHTATRLRSR